MTIPFSGRPAVTFLIGGLGAGKTELALNLAVAHAEELGAGKVDLLDLDIVNPYFRVRKVKNELAKLNVNVVTPDARVMNGDLPALPARVWAALDNPERCIVCDVGGGELGLRPLARLREYPEKRDTRVLFVVNPFRPGFQRREEMEKSFRHMEGLSALKVTHLVANPHLVHETTADTFTQGWEMIGEFAASINMPVLFGMATPEVREALPTPLRDRVLAVRRFWRLPWVFGAEATESHEESKNRIKHHVV